MDMPILDAIACSTASAWKWFPASSSASTRDTRRRRTASLTSSRRSQIPMLTINLLQALPRTPLWDRSQKDGRIVPDQGRESNVAFRLPYDDVVAMWRRCIADSMSRGTLSAFRLQSRAHLRNRINRRPSGRAPTGRTSARHYGCPERLHPRRPSGRLSPYLLEFCPAAAARGANRGPSSMSVLSPIIS